MPTHDAGLAAEAEPTPTPVTDDARTDFGDVALTEEQTNTLSTFLREEINRSEHETREFRENIVLWREFIDPPDREKNFPWPHASNIFIPIPRTVLDALKASVKQTISKQKKMFIAEITNAAAAGIEDAQVHQAQMAAAEFAEKISVEPGYLEFKRVLDEWVEELLVTGIGPVQIISETDQRNVVLKGKIEETITFSTGPRLFVIPVGTWVWPAGLWRNLQEMSWLGRWIRLTPSALRVRAMPPWNYKNVEETIQSADQTQAGEDELGRSEAAGVNASERGLQTYDIQLLWSTNPSAPSPQFHDIIVTYNLSANKIHRIIYNPAGDAQKNYEVEVASPRPGTIFGRGIIEPIVQPVRGINTAINQTFDSQTLANAPTILYPEGTEAADILTDGFFPGMPLPYKESKDEIGILQFPDASASSFALVQFFMTIIERLTRIGPSRLGEVSEGRRTPASLGLATQQIGAELIDELIDRLRDTGGRLVSRTFLLYLEEDPGIFVRLLGDEDGNLLRGIIEHSRDTRTAVNQILRIRLSASSAVRSMELERQNAQATAQLTFFWHQQALTLVKMFLSPVDAATGQPVPQVAKDVMLDILKSGQEQMKRMVELANQPDAATLIPDLAARLEQVSAQIASPTGGPATPPTGSPTGGGGAADILGALGGAGGGGQ